MNDGNQDLNLFIGGNFIPSSLGECFQAIEPASGEILTNVSLASQRDIDLAVAAARDAFDVGVWPKLPASTRAQFLHDIASLLEERADSLAEIESRDSGMPISMTLEGHIPRAIAHFRYFAEEAERVQGENYPMNDAYLNFVTREPVGVAAIFAPWNAPLAVATINVAAAIALGNTCILKPSEKTCLTANALAEICAEVGLPPGVINVVYGPGSPTGEALVNHSDVDVISFVGGTHTGRTIMAKAARSLKRVGLELGGKSAAIVFSDVDVDRALDGILLSAFSSNGEVCTSASRILVQRSLYHSFLEELVTRTERIVVGDPLRKTTELGPLISKEHRDQVCKHIEFAIKEGGRLHCGGDIPGDLNKGFYLRPSVLSQVHNKMKIAQDEVFGPVVVVMEFDSEDEAIAIANDSEFGLAAYVWFSNMERALSISKRLRSGTVAINSPVIRDIRVPFGGYKQSGIGRVGGCYSVDLFTEVKTTCIPINPFKLPRLGAK